MTYDESLRWLIDNKAEIGVRWVEGYGLVMGVFKDDVYSVFALDDPIAQNFLANFIYPSILAVKQELENPTLIEN
jgi:hypothetical protein